MEKWNDIFTPLTICKLTYGDNVDSFNGNYDKIKVANEVSKRFMKYLEDNYEVPKPNKKSNI